MSLSSFSLCLALKSLMFHSNLGLINTVSSVRSKPSFEVKLVSLRSSGGREKETQKRFSFRSGNPQTPRDASYGQSLGSIAFGHLHGAWSATKQASALFGALAFHTDHPILCSRTSSILCSSCHYLKFQLFFKTLLYVLSVCVSETVSTLSGISGISRGLVFDSGPLQFTEPWRLCQ